MWYPMSTECQWTHNTWKVSKTHFKVSTSMLSPWLNKCGPWQLWKSTWTRTSLAERRKWPFGFSGHQLNKSQLCLPGIIFLVPFIILFFLSFTFYYYISLSCRGRGGASLVAQLVKNLPAMQENPGSISESKSYPREGIGYPLQYSWAFLVAQMVKNLPAMRETWARSLCWENPLEEGMATHSSILAWRIPWTEESGRV